MWKIQQDVRVLACISGAYDFSHLKHVSCKMPGNLTPLVFSHGNIQVLFLLWLYFWAWGHVSSPWLSVLVPTLSASILAGMGAVDPKSSIHRGYCGKWYAKPVPVFFPSCHIPSSDSKGSASLMGTVESSACREHHGLLLKIREYAFYQSSFFLKGGTTSLAVPFQFLWWYLQISGTRRKSEVHRRHFQFKVKQNIATLDFSQSFLIHFPSPTCQELQAHTHLATWIGRLAPPARGGAPGDSDVSIYGWIKPILPCLGSWTCTYIQYT